MCAKSTTTAAPLPVSRRPIPRTAADLTDVDRQVMEQTGETFQQFVRRVKAYRRWCDSQGAAGIAGIIEMAEQLRDKVLAFTAEHGRECGCDFCQYAYRLGKYAYWSEGLTALVFNIDSTIGTLWDVSSRGLSG